MLLKWISDGAFVAANEPDFLIHIKSALTNYVQI